MTYPKPLDSTSKPLKYLAAQAFCAAFCVAILYSVGSSIFIVANGAERFPYAYIWTCCLVPPLMYAYNRLQQIWSSARLNLTTVMVFVLLQLVAWMFAKAAKLDIAAYVLFVSYTLGMSFLTIVVTTQANRLYTAEQMKSQFPLVLATQTVAIVLVGFLVAPLSEWLRGELQTVLLGSAMLLIMLAVLVQTAKIFPQLSSVPDDSTDLPSDSRVNLTNRPVAINELLTSALPRLLFTYQFLSSLTTLLIMYVLPIAASQVLTSSREFTGFFGTLMAVATLGSLVFLVFGASAILRNRGIGFGLLANPVGVMPLVLLMLFVSVFAPTYSVVLLWLSAITRAVDFILSIGTTETAVNTFIKQLPDNTQLAVITTINAGVFPLSYGVAGVIALFLQFTTEGTLAPVLVVTVLVGVGWLLSANRLSRFTD